MFWTSTSNMKELLGELGYYVWNWFLIAGGIFGALGAAQRNFRIEIIATPLLMAGSAAYSLSLLPRVMVATSPGGLAGLSSIFMGVSFLMIGHGVVLWRRVRIANDVDRRLRDGQ